MVRSCAIPLALTLCLMGSHTASARPFDQIGGACVPDGATIRAGIYETRGFGIGFSGSNTGRIRLLCPFNVTGDMIGVMIGITFLSVIDDDGMGVGARVTATFRHAGLASNIPSPTVSVTPTFLVSGTTQRVLPI